MVKSFSLSSAALLVVLGTAFASTANAEQPAPVAAPQAATTHTNNAETGQTSANAANKSQNASDPLELKSFTGEFRQYTLGDSVPALYRTKEYNITNWQSRNLPAPKANSHWTYFGGSYVLINDQDGKILRIFSGDIIYR